MTMTQFAMVEELASLIKDNLSCKHLVLSVEEALVNFLQEDASPGGVLELQPMSPYERLLLHRLADIYGFSHESVGEGDDRHLVLERHSDTAIPAILVSDILWQSDEYQSPSPSHNILRRKEVPELKKNGTLPASASFEEREAAYLAARERIFSLDRCEGKEISPPKSRKIPVVAQRMIAHALGTKISSHAADKTLHLEKCEQHMPSCADHSIEAANNLHWHKKKTFDKPSGKGSMPDGSISARNADTRAPDCSSAKEKLAAAKGNGGRAVGAANLEREQTGAAKRLFAHALGLNSGRVNQGSSVKVNQLNGACKQGM